MTRSIISPDPSCNVQTNKSTFACEERFSSSELVRGDLLCLIYVINWHWHQWKILFESDTKCWFFFLHKYAIKDPVNSSPLGKLVQITVLDYP